MTDMKRFEDLLGKTLKGIVGGIGDEQLLFTLDTGQQCKLYHEQNCCESVDINDICGDLADLLGSPILLAEEVIHQNETPPGLTLPKHHDDSFTWTFYKLATMKGAVTIRWLGESNGYYSESVFFVEVPQPDSTERIVSFPAGWFAPPLDERRK